MAIDRAAVLRNAEKLLRQGKLEPAISEYLRIIEDQPHDWTTANGLGDLYIRAGQIDKAVEQFARIADNLAHQGFLPRAAALYKKILKFRPDDERALLRAGEMAAGQGLLVDARSYYGAVAARRQARGDRPGVAEIAIRLGSLDPADFNARRTAARAEMELGHAEAALRDFNALAADLTDKSRIDDALDVLQEAVGFFPGDRDLHRGLFTAYLSLGDLERAREHATTRDHLHALGQALMTRGDTAAAADWLSAQNAQSDLHPLLDVAIAKVRAGFFEEGLTLLRQLLNQEPARAGAVVSFGCDLAESSAEAGFRIVEMAAETSIIEGDWTSAAIALQQLVARVPNHVPGLLRLVEICVDGGLDAELYDAQVQLADAYLASGAAAEARVIAEDLVSRSPGDSANIDRLRRALTLLGIEDSDALLAERLSEVLPVSDEVFDAADLGLQDGDDRSTSADDPASDDPFDLGTGAVDLTNILTDAEQADNSASPDEMAEIDLTVLLDEFKGAPAIVEWPRAEPAPAPDVALDEVFERIRGETARRPAGREGEREYERGIALREAGRIEESIQPLEAASRSPLHRFRAAAALGRIYRDRRSMPQAIEWFERAAQTPPPAADEAHQLFYELAGALESVGEVARALAVCLELQAEAGEYRDVAVRINRLTKAQARG